MTTKAFELYFNFPQMQDGTAKLNIGFKLPNFEAIVEFK